MTILNLGQGEQAQFQFTAAGVPEPPNPDWTITFVSSDDTVLAAGPTVVGPAPDFFVSSVLTEVGPGPFTVSVTVDDSTGTAVTDPQGTATWAELIGTASGTVAGTIDGVTPLTLGPTS